MEIIEIVTPPVVKKDQIINYISQTHITQLKTKSYRIQITNETLENKDRHIKKKRNKFEIQISRKEELRAVLKFRVRRLRAKIRLFGIQTGNGLDHKMTPIKTFLDRVDSGLAQDSEN